MRVPLGRDELRGKVVWRATRRVCLADGNLSQPHVCELHMPVLVEKKVLGLQITEDYLLAVQVLEGECRAGHIELGAVLLAPEVLLVVGRIQLAAERQLEEQVERLLPVEGLIELDDKGRVAHELHVLLAHDARLHPGLDYVALAQGLERVGVARLHVLDHLNGSEAAAAEESHALQVLAVDVAEALARARLLVADLLHDGRARLAALVQLFQGAQQHVEGGLVDRQRGGRLRGDLDRGGPGLIFEQRLLAEHLRRRGRRGEVRHLFAVLDHAHRALYEDVEEVARLALLENRLVLLEAHLVQRLGEFHLLLVLERIQELDLVEVLNVLLAHLLRGRRQDALELQPIDNHDRRRGPRNHGRGARRGVQERELAEALAARDNAHAGGRRFLGALAVLRHQHLEGAVHDDVEVVGGEVALLDDLRPNGHILPPHHVNHLLNLALVQVEHRLQIIVRPQRICHQILLLSSLRAGRLRVHLRGSTTAHGTTLLEFQLLVEAQLLKHGTGHAEALDL
mmetsp:Transcript_56408/g.160128  ORF Transcript_56408/g.160128 Transcript_56408/m.160128 type:complete len:512 (-) Transcript_56408:383-1918(-)